MQHLLAGLGMTLLLVGSASAAAAADLRAYTENFPPFNYLQEQQESGISVELLRMVAQRANLDIQMSFLPWQRAVNENAMDANSILFTTVRTPQRENTYRWVGPIDACDIALIKLKKRQDIQIGKLEDAFRYTVGIPTAGADFETLSRLGFPAGQLRRAPPSASVIRMLYAERFDLASGILLSYAYQARQVGLPAGELVSVYPLQKGSGCYFAFNSRVDPELFRRFETAFKELERDGAILQLRRHYLND
ncbi:substrate-binding periplasmic protein [Chitinilyticum piscinae]|uniref:Transporter substrate-binding domain-containing protein n=1 Tax=Chitinilyticum piscinae TaxID=2866724 RepID=A0A8J7FZ05_9NEIS|nr:transporter substrate-binding domain-containing protein [Chitinilyticum piscinae]MBE9608288.1 transporter substrate-binding domain-containing protein [Chitinilyticum piscinae]